MPEIESFLTEISLLVDHVLDESLPKADAEPTRLHEAIRWSIFAGGKRFRPALTVAVGRVFGTDDVKLLKTAAAIEMVHTFSLIHDDLPAMDNDDLRRGKATCHKKFDEATAILAGDVLQTLAFKTIAEDERLSVNNRLLLISGLANATGTPSGMVAGQQFDIEAEGAETQNVDIERIHNLKTGALINFSAGAGAIIGGGDESKVAIINEYAAQLGLLFQITDDLLDVSQTSEILGKTAGKDAAAMKATYPSQYGFEEAVKMANDVHKRAIESLSPLNLETGLLRDLSDHILSRVN